MNFEQELIAKYQNVRRLSRQFPLIDFAVLCVLSSNRDPKLNKQKIADILEVNYINVWNSLRRLELCGLALGTRISEQGRIAMGRDPYSPLQPRDRVAALSPPEDAQQEPELHGDNVF